MEVADGVPLGPVRLDERWAKHAVAVERMLQHRAVTRLEDVKRQQRVREKQRPRQRHDRHFVGQCHGVGHSSTEAIAKIYAPPRW
jgi:hypothetical protein